MLFGTKDGGRAVLVVVAAALLVRLAALWAASGAGLVLDEQLYLLRAEALLDGDGFVGSYQSWVLHPRTRSMAVLPQYLGAYQPPGYTLFLAAILAVTRRSVLAVKLVQALLGALTVGFVYAIGLHWLDRRRALLAAWICALYPTLIAFTHYLWSETLFIFLLALAVWVLTRDQELIGPRAAVAGGALLALAALTRSALFWFVPVICLWLIWSRRDRPLAASKRAACVIAAAIVVIAPWSLRNSMLHGGFVWIDTSGAFNLWRGNAPDAYSARPAPPQFSYAPPFQRLPLMPVGPQDQRSFVEAVRRDLSVEQPSDLLLVRDGRALAGREILSNPGLFARRAWTKLIDLWNPTSFLMRQFRLGVYGAVRPATEAIVSWMAIVSYLVVMGLAAAGAAASWRDRHTALVLLFVLFVSAASVAAFGLTRFRLPVIPFLALLASSGAFALADRLSLAVRKARV